MKWSADYTLRDDDKVIELVSMGDVPDAPSVTVEYDDIDEVTEVTYVDHAVLMAYASVMYAVLKEAGHPLVEEIDRRREYEVKLRVNRDD